MHLSSQVICHLRGLPNISVTSSLGKSELEELCKKAMAIDMAIDPEGCTDDRE
jgi:hypothetical protein